MTQEALKHLKAITEAFGPDAGIELDQKAWAKLHTAIKEALAQTQEPWCMKMNDCKTKCEDCPDEPPQRKPLTVQEIAAFVGTHEYGPEQLKWFRLGEAAHGIKENT